jgi:hypothetical protein
MSMLKEYRTADELSDMILSALAAKDVARPGSQGSRLRAAADRRCISRGFNRLSKTS